MLGGDGRYRSRSRRRDLGVGQGPFGGDEAQPEGEAPGPIGHALAPVDVEQAHPLEQLAGRLRERRLDVLRGTASGTVNARSTSLDGKRLTGWVSSERRGAAPSRPIARYELRKAGRQTAGRRSHG